MIDKNTKICVLYGGISEERNVSLETGKNMAEALQQYTSNVTLVDVDKDVAKKLIELKPDICVLGLHGTFGEDGTIQGLLESMQIPYTGSGVTSSAITFDKVLTKYMFTGVGIETPKYKVFTRDSYNNSEKPLCIPCVVKPAKQGSSIGVSIVENESEYAKAIDEAFKLDSQIIVEQYIQGKELTVPVLDGKAYPAIWIKPKKQFYDYECKYTKGMTEYLLDTELSDEMYSKVLDVAVKAYNGCMCRGVARVDFMVTDSEVFTIEINSLPGMTSTSLVPQSFKKAGIEFAPLVKMIADSATLDNVIKG